MSETVNPENSEWTGRFEVPVTEALYNRADRRKKFTSSEPDKKGRSLRLREGRDPQVPWRVAARLITDAVVYAGTDKYIRYLSMHQEKRRRRMIGVAREYRGVHGVFDNEANTKVTVDPSYKVNLDPEKVRLAVGPHAPTVVTESLVAEISVPPNIDTPFGVLTPALADTLVRSAITGAVEDKNLSDAIINTQTKRKVQEAQLTKLLIDGNIAEEDINYAGTATQTWTIEVSPIDAKLPAAPVPVESMTEVILPVPAQEMQSDSMQPVVAE